MKKIVIPMAIWVLLLVSGWFFGSGWAGQLERAKKMDEATAKVTRLNCQVKAMGIGASIGLVVTPVLFAWLRRREKDQMLAEQGGGPVR